MAATAAAPSAIGVISRPYKSHSTTSTSFSSSGKKVYWVRGLNAYGGLKPVNKLMRMGVAPTADEQFARLATVCKARRGGGGGALTARCSIGGEIARVVPIMSGLVLMGIAVGFVLLRIEAFVEESQSE